MESKKNHFTLIANWSNGFSKVKEGNSEEYVPCVTGEQPNRRSSNFTAQEENEHWATTSRVKPTEKLEGVVTYLQRRKTFETFYLLLYNKDSLMHKENSFRDFTV